MKKVMILTVFFMAVSAISINAQNNQARQSQNSSDTTANNCTNGHGQNFVDNNNDGICDNFQSGITAGHGHGFTDANNNGICDHHENGNGCNIIQKRAGNYNCNFKGQGNHKRNCRNNNRLFCPKNPNK